MAMDVEPLQGETLARENDELDTSLEPTTTGISNSGSDFDIQPKGMPAPFYSGPISIRTILRGLTL
jgi:hypothetical protein